MTVEKIGAWMERLPEECWTLLPSTGELVLVKRGESGYYPQRPENAPWGAENKDILNERMGVTKAQEKAMSMGSMVGWHTPASNPDNYDQDGNWKRNE
jgi:hypothetical protein